MVKFLQIGVLLLKAQHATSRGEYGSCFNPVERDIGSCMICSKHFCTAHAQEPLHQCPSQVCHYLTINFQFLNYCSKPRSRRRTQMLTSPQRRGMFLLA